MNTEAEQIIKHLENLQKIEAALVRLKTLYPDNFDRKAGEMVKLIEAPEKIALSNPLLKAKQATLDDLSDLVGRMWGQMQPLKL